MKIMLTHFIAPNFMYCMPLLISQKNLQRNSNWTKNWFSTILLQYIATEYIHQPIYLMNLNFSQFANTFVVHIVFTWSGAPHLCVAYLCASILSCGIHHPIFSCQGFSVGIHHHIHEKWVVLVSSLKNVHLNWKLMVLVNQ